MIDKIYNEVDHDYIQGITISGGDPFDQTDQSLKELLMFIKQFKSRFPSKDIWVYSGGIYEELIKNNIIKEILNLCDVLVDGPFIRERKELDLPFRGSSNQRIIKLSQ